MALAHFQRTFTGPTGVIQPGISVTVRNESTGAMAAIYIDKEGQTSAGNPLKTDATGYLSFYAKPGRYRITGPDIDWRNEDLVTFEALDEAVQQATMAADAAILNSGIYATTTDGLAATADGDYFSVQSPEADEYLILYRNDAGVATEIDTYPNSEAVRRAATSGIAWAESISDLSSIVAPQLGQQVSLPGYRGGIFEYRNSDLSAEVAADVLQGVYVAPSSDQTGASGAWVRQYSGAIQAAWFGGGDPAVVDHGPACRAAVAVAPAGSQVDFPASLMDCSLGENNAVVFVDKSLDLHVPLGSTLRVADGSQALQSTGEIITNQGPAKTLDDLAIGATSAFTGSALTEYYIAIDGAGSPNTFKWSKDNGATFVQSAVAITGSDQPLDNGVTIRFGSTTGHNVGSLWYLLYDGPDSHVIRIGNDETNVNRVRVFGAGALDGNRANNLGPSYLAVEISSGVMCDGDVSGVRIEGVTIQNVGGRTTMCRAKAGKAVRDVKILHTKSLNCEGGHLGGHPEYDGTVTGWRIKHNDILGCKDAAVEPNFNCSDFDVINNYIDDFQSVGIHLWRGPSDGRVSNNRVYAQVTGDYGIIADSPGGYPGVADIEVTGNRVYGTLINAIRMSGDSAEVSDNKMFDVLSEGLVVTSAVATIQSNTVYTCQKRGLVLRSAQLTAKGNTVINAGQNGTTRGAIEIESINVGYVQGNTVINPSVTGPDYGIWAGSTASGGYIVNNTINSAGMNLGGISNNGAITATDNYL